MLCYLLKIFSFGSTKISSDTDPAAAGAAAASAVCTYDVVIGGRFAPPYKYVVKYIQQKQQQLQQQQDQCLKKICLTLTEKIFKR